jgi:hypothetical protein
LQAVALIRDPDNGSNHNARRCAGAAQTERREPLATVTRLAAARRNACEYSHSQAHEEADAGSLECGAATGPEQPADDYPPGRGQRQQAAVGAQVPVI